MASRAAKKKTKEGVGRRLRRWLRWFVVRFVLLVLALILLFAIVNPAVTPYMISERIKHGSISREWVSMSRIAPVMARSAVAAEDANFCQHWGLDLGAIQNAIEDGGGRGASTVTQQVVKNVYLWHGRSWGRKAAEAILAPLVELVWSKRRIVEVYLNVAEFDLGVFGVEAAARHYFGTTAAQLTPLQSARLAAILPNPKTRSASNPSSFVRRRTGAIMDGAETIKRDGRAACFEDVERD